jgi:carbohydrate-binding DOMON domain-containing protein
MPVFAGLLTRYTTKRAGISSSLACQYSQVYLPATPPNAPESAAASHASIRRSTYVLHHQTRRVSSSLACQYSQVYLQATPPNAPESVVASHSSIRRSTYKLHHQTRRNQQQPRMPVSAGLLTCYHQTRRNQ